MPYVEILRIRNALIFYAAVIIVLAAMTIIFVHGARADFLARERHVAATGVRIERHVHAHTIEILTVRSVRDHGREKRAVISRSVFPRHTDVYAVRSSASGATIVYLVAGFFAAAFATVCGRSVAAEIDGHLGLVWTRPLSRSAYLARMFLIDTIGIGAATAFALIGIAAVVADVSFDPRIEPYASTKPIAMIAGLVFKPSAFSALQSGAFALAWFGITTALSAVLRRRSSPAIAIVWLSAVLLVNAGGRHLPLVGALLHGINTINPLAYYHVVETTEGSAIPLVSTAMAAHVLPLVGIALAGVLVAGWRWRRLEV